MQNNILSRQKRKTKNPTKPQIKKKKTPEKMQKQENSLLWGLPAKFIKIKGGQVVPLKSL